MAVGLILAMMLGSSVPLSVSLKKFFTRSDPEEDDRVGISPNPMNSNDDEEENPNRLTLGEKFRRMHSGPKVTYLSIMWDIMTVAIYLGYGAIVFSRNLIGLELGVDNSFYFAVSTFTTVGFSAPKEILTSNYATIFTSFYVLIGVFVVGTILSDLAEVAFEHRIATVEKRKREMDKSFEELLLSDGILISGNDDSQGKLEQTEKLLLEDAKQRKKKFYDQVFIALIPLAMLYVTGVFIMLDDKRKEVDVNPYIAAFYFMVTTATTVGYGDIAPGFDEKMTFIKIVLCFVIPLACFSVAALIARSAIYNADRNLSIAQLSIITKGLSQSNLQELDADGNGEVSLMEFVEFMLIAMRKVDEHTMNMIKNQFASLDMNGDGKLTTLDLQQFYKLKKKQMNSASFETSGDSVILKYDANMSVGGGSESLSTTPSRKLKRVGTGYEVVT